ncbi:MAG: ABC transporter substrate-binding protein [Chloroflexi bacterium]|nr:ABC transporter substrate-binding protein [Chloroflexota bacterium]
MRKKYTWLLVSVLTIVSLVLASCAPKVTEEKAAVTEEKKAVTEKKEVVTEKKEVVTEDKKGAAAKEEPQYGGWLNYAITADPPEGFSRTTNYGKGHVVMNLYTSESLLQTNPLKGPVGSGEWSMMYPVFPPVSMLSGALAESWEIIQPDTLRFTIRKGVHWQNKPPANGAELTAEDVVYSYVLGWSMPGSAWPTAYPYLSDLKNPENSIYIDPDNRWVVVLKAKPGTLSLLWERMALHVILPKALGDPKGTAPDTWTWKTWVGTGPFVLTDYVMGSLLTWTRNPDYWQKDPFRTQNQLPYLDGARRFIIPDLATQFAALRTGKLDTLSQIGAEDTESLMMTSPKLLSAELWGTPNTLSMRLDVKPWDDVRVRRAMMMAIDHDEIVREYYKGKAEKFYWPAFPIVEHRLMYRPLKEMPQSVQELYEYHPDKAKQLLAEAGYPKGFNTSIVVSSAQEEHIDLLSIVQAYWAKVGVDLKIDVKEPAVKVTMDRAFSYEQGTFNNSPNFVSMADALGFRTVRVGSSANLPRVNDPLVEETLKRVGVAYWDWTEVSQIVREAMPELQNHVLFQFLPMPTTYNLWWPWLKNYSGQPTAIRYGLSNWDYFVWIDQDLKQKMTGRR